MSGRETPGAGRVGPGGDDGKTSKPEPARVETRDAGDELSRLEWRVRDTPSDGSAWSRLAFAYCEADRGDLALDAAQRATLLAPREGLGWWALSVAWFMNEDREAALGAVREAARLLPGNAHVQFILGSRLLDCGFPREAVPVLEVARHEHPASFAIRRALALARHEAGEHAAAVEALNEVLRVDPGFPSLWVALGASLADLGRYAEARNALETAVFHLPDDGEAWGRLGQACHELGNHPDAVAAFGRAVDHGYTVWGVWRDLGLSAAETRDLSTLARACDELEKGRPTEAAQLRARLEELRAKPGARARRRRRSAFPCLDLVWPGPHRGEEKR